MFKRIVALLVVIIMAVSGAIYKHFSLDKNFMYAGTLETTKVILSSKLSTDILQINVEEGDSVKKGDLIAKLNDDIFQIASKQLNNDYIRANNLIGKGHIPAKDYDVIEKLKKNNDLYIKWCEIRSPIDGTVISKFKEVGEFVSIGTNLVSIADTNNIWAYFYVAYDVIHNIKVGDKVVGYLQECGNKPFSGTIIKINEEAEFTPKNVQTREERSRLIYGVKVKFDNSEQKLKAGMTMEIQFE